MRCRSYLTNQFCRIELSLKFTSNTDHLLILYSLKKRFIYWKQEMIYGKINSNRKMDLLSIFRFLLLHEL